MKNKVKEIDMSFLNSIYRDTIVSKILFENGVEHKDLILEELCLEEVNGTMVSAINQKIELLESISFRFNELGLDIDGTLDFSNFDMEYSTPGNICSVLTNVDGPFVPLIGNKLYHYRDIKPNNGITNFQHIFCSSELDNFIDNLKSSNSDFNEQLVFDYFQSFSELFHPYETPSLCNFTLKENSHESLYLKNTVPSDPESFKYNIVICYTVDPTTDYYEFCEDDDVYHALKYFCDFYKLL